MCICKANAIANVSAHVMVNVNVNVSVNINVNGNAILSATTANGLAPSTLKLIPDIGSAGGYDGVSLPSTARLTWGDAINTFLEVNTDSPEDLQIAADDDLVLRPDDDLIIQAGSTTYATFFAEGKARIGSTSTSAPTSILDVGGDITATHITKVTVKLFVTAKAEQIPRI